ncbi:Hydrogenase maturation protease [Bradyrhizobium sp. STM 3843]|uniref:hydrogenase maturation protease n=1 Tax=Bradyrhizobium sp. STM 3843 TaxID=551947 RepID=UPI000240378D|nr:hydrogenase maturation protease [Bradyrhizobium sp. STM 3843]CCE07797.1 Hydrogenase maturation protease [Bradyrhizobium sp. STM 3843]
MNDPAHRRIAVLGIGNVDRGDDAVGVGVAHRLARRLPSDVALLVCNGDILGLVEDWAKYDALICVDAAAPMGTPGRIHRLDAAQDELPPCPSLASSHAFGLAEAIALARELGVLPNPTIVYAIEGACFDAGGAITPKVAAALDATAERIITEIGRMNSLAAPAET